MSAASATGLLSPNSVSADHSRMWDYVCWQLDGEVEREWMCGTGYCDEHAEEGQPDGCYDPRPCDIHPEIDSCWGVNFREYGPPKQEVNPPPCIDRVPKKPNIHYYTITASNLADAWTKVKHVIGDQAHFTFNINYNPSGSNGKVICAGLDFTMDMTLPDWPGVSSQCKETQDKWKDVIDALIKHEQGHKDIFIKYFGNFERQLIGKNLETALRMFYEQGAQHLAAQNLYDKETGQGTNNVDTVIPMNIDPCNN